MWETAVPPEPCRTNSKLLPISFRLPVILSGIPSRTWLSHGPVSAQNDEKPDLYTAPKRQTNSISAVPV